MNAPATSAADALREHGPGLKQRDHFRQSGRNYLLRNDGSTESLGHLGSAELSPGDRFVIETPGVGGYHGGYGPAEPVVKGEQHGDV